MSSATPWIAGLLLVGAWHTGHGAQDTKPRVGDLAPWFRLEQLSGGHLSRGQLRGRTAVLVVGRTQKAAPPCRTWATEIIRRHTTLPVYQVIVVAKPWYVPRSVVLRKVKAFAPPRLHHRVLLEWYTAFAEVYGIAKHDDPVILVIDRKGRIRWRYRGAMTPVALTGLERVLRTEWARETLRP